MNIVLATGNSGKIREMLFALEESRINFVPQNELGIGGVIESGKTYVENALIKARFAAKHSKLPCIADDSGLEVDALQGEPNIYSARYSGETATAKSNIKKLLKKMEGIVNRNARFRTVIVFLKSEFDPAPVIVEGTWEGTILHEPRGDLGFSYDPIFYVPTHGCSAGEIIISEKSRISHRGVALTKLLSYISES